MREREIWREKSRQDLKEGIDYLFFSIISNLSLLKVQTFFSCCLASAINATFATVLCRIFDKNVVAIVAFFVWFIATWKNSYFVTLDFDSFKRSNTLTVVILCYKL